MGRLTRLPDWQARLQAWLIEVGGKSFEPGRHDCALFAAGAVAAMTGEDPAAVFRGRYRTLRGGLRVLRRAGWRDHVAFAAAHLDEINPLMARPGDLAVVPADGGDALGVVQGEWVYVLGLQGMGMVPLTSATRAFRL